MCLHCSHSDDSDQRACPSVGVWFLRLAGSTQPCQFSFSGCLLLVCHWTCCVMLIKDLKGQEAFGERSATGSGRNCEAPGGNPQGWISSQLSLFREKRECCWVSKLQGNMHDKRFISWQLYFMEYYKSWTTVHCWNAQLIINQLSAGKLECCTSCAHCMRCVKSTLTGRRRPCPHINRGF